MHIPVLTEEITGYLDPKANENFIDCTIGGGGHAKMILEKNGPNGKVLGIDIDKKQIENCKLLLKDFGDRLILVNDSYVNLEKIIEEKKFGPVNPVRSQGVSIETQKKQTSNGVNGILLDLGMSSEQLKESGRGFSFQKDEPLDMRYNAQNLTAENIINKWPEKEIEKILKEYGEEKFSRQIAKKIIEERKTKEIKSTFQLVEIIKKAIPSKFQHYRIHCATRTFQALRIAVNDELNNLIKVLPQAISTLPAGGRLVAISFHSLEDRIVKNFLKEKARENIKILTKKPITAGSKELRENPCSRSAKLRAAVII
ncbi:MAG: hypothetical protein CEN87_328 [Parcubacteria group bacterium Licking1014_1]|nr:MAG: hypothetical protein CEN87_328 [Parcubacteria group bacterium Licking1014_1]